MNERTVELSRTFRIVLVSGILLLLLTASGVMARSQQPAHFTASEGVFQEGTGTLRGLVFEDTNENQSHDPGEPGIDGVTVELYEVSNGSAGTPLQTDVTVDGGRFEFSDVPAGNYRVSIVVPESHAALAGDDRLASVLADLETEVFFPLVQPDAPGAQPTATEQATPTTGPTFTPTATSPPTNTPRPTNTPEPTSTGEQSPTPTGTATPTPTTTTTPTPTGTLFPITPILITTTPGVFVTTTPVPGTDDRLPDTGVGTGALLWALGFGTLMMMAAGLRRFFRDRY